MPGGFDVFGEAPRLGEQPRPRAIPPVGSPRLFASRPLSARDARDDRSFLERAAEAEKARLAARPPAVPIDWRPERSDLRKSMGSDAARTPPGSPSAYRFDAPRSSPGLPDLRSRQAWTSTPLESPAQPSPMRRRKSPAAHENLPDYVVTELRTLGDISVKARPRLPLAKVPHRSDEQTPRSSDIATTARGAPRRPLAREGSQPRVNSRPDSARDTPRSRDYSRAKPLEARTDAHGEARVREKSEPQKKPERAPREKEAKDREAKAADRPTDPPADVRRPPVPKTNRDASTPRQQSARSQAEVAKELSQLRELAFRRATSPNAFPPRLQYGNFRALSSERVKKKDCPSTQAPEAPEALEAAEVGYPSRTEEEGVPEHAGTETGEEGLLEHTGTEIGAEEGLPEDTGS